MNINEQVANVIPRQMVIKIFYSETFERLHFHYNVTRKKFFLVQMTFSLRSGKFVAVTK